ncbi:hypothetical protein WA026_009714 [Henosepilachna vigintioctopunctata]|uniref:Protein stoned-A n=1 Tax=Henosepilachna vigintioctopunctata TaxID=420089 RepID=A0AAW1TRS3_9CUCU
MHKITKGLKKKKKGKKSKHKEEELFKPEELEAYRREHQAHLEAGEVENEEWKKFHALTSGIDNVLQKTQEELSRIKETSFFQRVAPPSEVKEKEKKAAAEREALEKEFASTQETKNPEPTNLGIVELSESESEADEEEDDVFNTAYIDAIAAGEVKLAYIPESPKEETGDDPFDTSYAEKAILGPAVAKKGKKLVPIGAAVEVLTGRIQLPTCSTQRPVPNKRQILKERDLLLGSFDDNANSIDECIKDSDSVAKTLLDEDAPPNLSSEPIDLSKSLYIPSPVAPSSICEPVQKTGTTEDLEDDEFAQLAAESLNKEPVNKINVLPSVTPAVIGEIENSWDAFPEKKNYFEVEAEDLETEADPFDTTFAENILPGKAELKQIESEILNSNVEVKVKPQQEKLLHILKKLSISEDDTRGVRTESELKVIQIEHRDLLGGSNTDLSNLNRPLTPASQIDDNYIEYSDPFDTSIVETVKKPGQTELKFLEKELLTDLENSNNQNLSDDDFDPRAEEIPESSRERIVSRPDILNITSSKSVCFDASSLKEKDFIEIDTNSSKLSKPPTPFYVRKNSVPGSTTSNTSPDPFDTDTTFEEDVFKSDLNEHSSALETLNENNFFSNPVDDFDDIDTFDPFDTSIANNVISNNL